MIVNRINFGLKNLINPFLSRRFCSIPPRWSIVSIKSRDEYQMGRVTQSKGGRPAVRLSTDDAVEASGTVALAFFTSKKQGAEHREVPYKELVLREESGLSKDSYVHTGQLVTISKKKYASSRLMGSLEEGAQNRVANKVKLSFRNIPSAHVGYRQGDILEIQEGVARGRRGIVVSNNPSNKSTEVVMISRVLKDDHNKVGNNKIEAFRFSVLSEQETWTVDCNDIDTISKEMSVEKIGHLSSDQLKNLIEKIEKSLGI